MRRILVLGGGTAGTLAANFLARELRSEIKKGKVEITLLDEDGTHLFQPNLLYISFKGMKPEKIERPEKKLLHKRIKFHIDPVAKIDFKKKEVTTKTKKTYLYDVLVIAVGAKIIQDEIPGLDEANMDFHSSPKNAWKIWERIRNIKSGKVVVGVSTFPHKCPPSPVEAAFLLEEFFKKRKLKDKVELHFITPLPRPYPDVTINDTVERLFGKRGITIHPFFNIDRVDSEKKIIYSMEGKALEFEAMFVVPPHKAPQAIIDSKIGDEDGWIPTDKYTMLVNGQKNVYAIGDVADLRTSKSGVTAHLEAAVVARNIIADIRQTGERCKFTGRTHCPMDVGYGKALFVISTYDKAAKDAKPTRRNLLMKKAFAKMYWTAVGGSLEWLFDRYFGEDARECFIEESY
ncbi:MAG: NAD(P)/FAD-dependent oxidoreductase [Candidatus Hermodarchaeota archaeon]